MSVPSSMSSLSTAERVFSKMQDPFTKHSISWDNCLGLGVDNTSVNMGCRNSIKTRVLGKNTAIYIMGCPCHIVHNTAVKAVYAFEEISRCNVEDMVIDIHYWFEKSTKHKASLAEFYFFCDIDYCKKVKHVNTTWLSLDRAVTWALQQLPGLKSYFLCNDINESRFRRLHALFHDPMTEVYLLFYQSSLQAFIQFNIFLQREDPIVYEQTFLQKLASEFLTVAALLRKQMEASVL